MAFVKSWDKIASQRPDKYVAISTAVQNRIKKYYKRNSVLIYPPVDIKRFLSTKQSTRPVKDNYFLYVSRLIPYKKPDLVVKAFNLLGKKLLVVGKGSEKQKLEKMAKENIKFIDFLSDEDLALYYQNAEALVFPGEEDFGIVMVEAIASGTPVIAYEKGGALDIVKNGVNGIFLESQNLEELVKTVRKFDKGKFSKKNMRNSIEIFLKEKFQEGIRDVVAKL